MTQDEARTSDDRWPAFADDIIRVHGDPYLAMPGVKGVGLRWVGPRIKFVILTEGAVQLTNVPRTIAGYEVLIENTAAESAARGEGKQ